MFLLDFSVNIQGKKLLLPASPLGFAEFDQLVRSGSATNFAKIHPSIRSNARSVVGMLINHSMLDIKLTGKA